MHQKVIYQSWWLSLSDLFALSAYLYFQNFPFMYICCFWNKEKEACSKSGIMGYMPHWKCAQYSKKEINLSGELKENLASCIFPILYSYMSLTCQPNAIHGLVRSQSKQTNCQNIYKSSWKVWNLTGYLMILR